VQPYSPVSVFIPLAATQERSYLIDLNSKTVTEIGTLSGDCSRATGINDAGQLAGFLPRLKALDMLSSPAPTGWA
jgi:hypothetical protein